MTDEKRGGAPRGLCRPIRPDKRPARSTSRGGVRMIAGRRGTAPSSGIDGEGAPTDRVPDVSRRLMCPSSAVLDTRAVTSALTCQRRSQLGNAGGHAGSPERHGAGSPQACHGRRFPPRRQTVLEEDGSGPTNRHTRGTAYL